jgi:hypothetical protein
MSDITKDSQKPTEAPPTDAQIEPSAPQTHSTSNLFETTHDALSPEVTAQHDVEEKIPDKESQNPLIPIHNLTLIMNGSRDLESTTLLKTMATLLKKFDIQPKAVYTMQPPIFLTDTITDGQIQSYDFMSIMIRGAEVSMNREIPAQYEIEKLPAWIAETPEGDVILEGYNDISSFFNAQGELKRSLLISTQENINDEILPPQQKEGPPPLSLQEKDSLFIQNAKKQLLEKLRERGSQLLQQTQREIL